MRTMFAMMRTMGDVIVSTAIVRELKRRDPESEIFFYTDKPYDSLLKNNTDIAKVMVGDPWDLNHLFLEMADGWDKVYTPYQVRPECNVWHQEEATRHQHLLDFYWRRMGMHG